MIFKRISVFVFILIFLFIMYPFVSAHAEIEPKKVLLLYDERYFYGYAGDVVVSYRELFGHFHVKVLEQNEEDYKKGQVENYDVIFVMGLKGSFTNKDLIEDLKTTKKIVCWIGKGIEKLLEGNKNITFQYAGSSDNLVKVFYKQKDFDIGFIDDFVLIDNISDNSAVYSWVSDGSNKYPFIIKEKNYWYVAKANYDSVLFYIFADILHDIFNEYTIEKNRVFIRIEDVHPFRDTEKLRAIAQYLNSQNIPFMIALIPTYQNPETFYITTLSENTDFVETIRYMQELGGSIILHGYVHQISGEDATGEGFEFWDGNNNKPLEVDINQWIHDRIGLGIEESVKNGIYPLAFEAPHYAMCQKGYKILKKYFSTYCGQVQTSNLGYATTKYPYILHNTELFHKMIPENLGYVDPEDPLTINTIINKFEEVSIVRGFTAGLFFHPYIDIKYLKEIVKFIQQENIEFYDLKKDDHWVEWNDITIISKNGEIYTNYSPNIQNGKMQKNFNVLINGLIILILGVNGTFLILFIRSRKRSKEKLLGD